jgi:hypothetical protein
MDINKTLDERNNTHGDFSQVGAVAQTLKRILRETPNWKSLLPAQQEALEMDMTKTARILCGNSNEQDHWHDKAGYATLGARACVAPNTVEVRGPLAISTPTRHLAEAGRAAENKPAVPFKLPERRPAAGEE